ncbi:MAG: hypothetical protein WDO19_15650 [Bacteroidota bacterium]
MNTLLKLKSSSHKRKYGITENKKAELDHLANEVLAAQHKVEELQAIVSSLTTKSADYNARLALATSYQATAMNNCNLLTQMIQNVYSLFHDSDTAFLQMVMANAKTGELAKTMKSLIDKLIFCAQLINKLANQVTRQKAVNALISDDLVSLVATAGTDANNAVGLTLLALNSSFAGQSSILEAEACSTLELEEAVILYETLTGGVMNTKNIKNALNNQVDKFIPDPVKENESLQALLDKALKDANEQYSMALNANNQTIAQLNTAISNLNVAQVNLRSVQSALAAANAAAFAA